jgi:hypothetical protein
MFEDIVKKYEPFMDHPAAMDEVLAKLDVVLKRQPKNLPVIEVGTRLGGSIMCFMELLYTQHRNVPICTVDPYGSNLFYSDGVHRKKSKYTDEMYEQMKINLEDFFETHPGISHYQHFKCTSAEFIKKDLFKKYLWVYLDGDHHIDTVFMEIKYFLPKLNPKGCLVIDDTKQNIKKIRTFTSNLKIAHTITEDSNNQRCFIELK